MRAQEFTEPGSAGCIIVARDTGRWCLQQRSNSVSDPGVWSTWGGGREPGESVTQCVRRELAEESGYQGPVRLEPVDSNSQYATFLAHVPHEFEPELNAESQAYQWCNPEDLPEPLHPGLQQTLSQVTLNEGKSSFNQCFSRACQLYDRAVAKGRDATLLQVADYQGDGSAAGTRWQQLPQYVWKHYVTVIDDTVYDPTAKQFGPDKPEKYSLNQLKSEWKEIYQIRSTAVTENTNPGLSYIGNCTEDEVVDDIFGNVSEFARMVELYGDEFAVGDLVVKYDDDQDIHYFYYKNNSVSENFADGRVRGKSRPGRVKRAGASCAGSVTDLRARAKKYSGERGKMYHWCANMKSGRNKKE